MNLITARWRALNAEYHREYSGYGSLGVKWLKRILRLTREVRASTILDYGAGKCSLSRALDGIGRYTVLDYDPAIDAISHEPKPADFVVCTDVLEHVEPECVDAVLDHLRGLTGKGGFFVVALNEGRARMSDGTPAHVTLRPREWWLEKVRARWTVRVEHCHNRNRLAVFVRPC